MKTALLLLSVSVLALAATAVAAQNGTTRVVATAHNAKLGKTILVTKKGLTLYSLSAERHGRFICKTSACLAFWKPLHLAKGMRPGGVGGLGTVRRPDHTIQVTYRGAPLYTFYLDHKRGDVLGNGFRDVGVWRPVAVSRH
jgi:predicted lipoprotein with Yx(FWY)xxD motif